MGQGPPEVFSLCCLSGDRRDSWVADVIALLLGNWRLIGWTLAGLAILASASVAIGKYNDRIRAPLQKEIKFLTDSIEANKKQAQALLTQREKENADLAEKWRNYARQSDDTYEAKIASLRAAGSSGLRLYTGCGSTTGQASQGSPETPAKPAAESRTGDEARGVIFGPEEIGQVLQWYAYGQSCHAFVTGK